MFYRRQDFDIFLTSDTMLSNIFPMPIILTFEVVTVFLMILYQILADLIPSFIYYHAGTTITSIHDEINNKKDVFFKYSFKNKEGRDLLRIWSKYNRVRRLVKRADQLFGWMLLFDFGIKFFMVCLLSYNLLANSTRNTATTQIISLFLMITYIIRLVNSVSLMSEVQESRVLLTAQMSVHHNTHWMDVDAESRQVLSDFKMEVIADQLAASPLGLFTVNHGLMLTLLSLIVTYLLILIQLN